MNVFVDSSGFKAWLDERDEFHIEAEKIIEELLENKVELVTSNYIVDECSTMLRVKCGLKKAMLFREYILNSKQMIKIYRVSVSDEKKAWEWFKKDWSGLSFTDSVTFSQMKRLGIKGVFGFDQHFERAGFRLEKKR